MSDSVYAVLAYGARYWFALLAVVILWRAIQWMRKDAARISRVQRRLPDAGFIGEWVVVASDAPSIERGEVLRAPRDGWIGSARACDVRLLNAGVPPRAARFFLRPDGLHLQPQRSGSLLVDGEEVQREAILRHGATLTVGGVTLQLRLFAGVRLEGEMTAEEAQNTAGGKRRGRRRHRDDIEPADDLPEPILPPEPELDAFHAREGYAYDVVRYAEAPPDVPPRERTELPKPTLVIRTRKHNRRQ